MGKKAPQPTPPRETAQAQTGTNVATAIANAFLQNINEYTPEGSTTFTPTGSYTYTDTYTGQTYTIPTFSRYTNFTPEGQAIYDQQLSAKYNLSGLANKASGQMLDLIGSPFSLDSLPGYGTLYGMQEYIPGAGDVRRSIMGFGPGADMSQAFSADRDKVERALMERMNPYLEQDRERLRSQLSNQGIKLGSEAFTEGMFNYDKQANDARLAAILGAGQEQSRLYGMAAQEAGFENQAQNQAFGQNAMQSEFINSIIMNRFNAQNALRAQEAGLHFAARNQPINEVGALLSGGQVNMPNFYGANVGPIPTSDYAGIIQNYDNQRIAAWQAQQAQTGSIFGALGGLFGNMIMASDRRLKKDVRKVGNLYEYHYKGEPKGAPKHVGVMAQEVEKVRPDAVLKDQKGMRAVNYGALFGA